MHKSLYDTDESVKDVLPVKNEQDDLKLGLDNVQSLFAVFKGNETFAKQPKVKERLDLLGEVVANIEAHYVASDPDALLGHKREKDSFFGCKSHIAMSDARLVSTALASGEKDGGPPLQTLIKASRKNAMEVDVVVGDTAYSENDNIVLSHDEQNGFERVADQNPAISHETRKERAPFECNKYSGMVCISDRTYGSPQGPTGKKE